MVTAPPPAASASAHRRPRRGCATWRRRGCSNMALDAACGACSGRSRPETCPSRPSRARWRWSGCLPSPRSCVRYCRLPARWTCAAMGGGGRTTSRCARRRRGTAFSGRWRVWSIRSGRDPKVGIAERRPLCGHGGCSLSTAASCTTRTRTTTICLIGSRSATAATSSCPTPCARTTPSSHQAAPSPLPTASSPSARMPWMP
mmetsp:Transcript_12916/g.45786  ORF Transcript_12916/g.45786 Transcript_12916/m.45786 type:complete len:202 (-) Transcript_12916:1525-2130(-)